MFENPKIVSLKAFRNHVFLVVASIHSSKKKMSLPLSSYLIGKSAFSLSLVPPLGSFIMPRNRGIGLAPWKSRCLGAKEAKNARKNKFFGFWMVTHRKMPQILENHLNLAFLGQKITILTWFWPSGCYLKLFLGYFDHLESQTTWKMLVGLQKSHIFGQNLTEKI